MLQEGAEVLQACKVLKRFGDSLGNKRELGGKESR